MPDWVETGYHDYLKRISKPYVIELHEIPLKKRGPNADFDRLIHAEGAEMLSKIARDDIVIALDIHGSAWSTEEFATKLQHWRDANHNISLLIGGPEGLAKQAYEKATLKWSLSKLTLPHPMVRIILVEQIYRAISILNKHPYHK